MSYLEQRMKELLGVEQQHEPPYDPGHFMPIKAHKFFSVDKPYGLPGKKSAFVDYAEAELQKLNEPTSSFPTWDSWTSGGPVSKALTSEQLQEYIDLIDKGTF